MVGVIVGVGWVGFWIWGSPLWRAVMAMNSIIITAMMPMPNPFQLSFRLEEVLVSSSVLF